MIQLAMQGVILVLPNGRQKFPAIFQGTFGFFSAIFNGYYLLIYSKISRRIPKDILRTLVGKNWYSLYSDWVKGWTI